MGWLDAVDGYCERVSAAYWAEPLNAVTNLAFLLAAALLWRRVQGLPLARGMVAVLAAIGVGSFLFHTHATRLTAVADVVPIAVFILLYVFAASRDYLGLSGWQAAACTVAVLPYVTLTARLWGRVPGLGSSAGYAPMPVLILMFAVLLRHRAPSTAKGLMLAAGLFLLSLACRTADQPLCTAMPFGLHFIWHLLNAVLLGGLIVLYRRHTGATPKVLAKAMSGR